MEQQQALIYCLAIFSNILGKDRDTDKIIYFDLILLYNSSNFQSKFSKYMIPIWTYAFQYIIAYMYMKDPKVSYLVSFHK